VSTNAAYELTTNIRLWLFGAEYSEARLYKVTLRHVTAAGADRALKGWPVDPDPSAINIESLAQEILHFSQRDANGWGGEQRYLVDAYFGGDPNPRERTPVFSVRSETNSLTMTREGSYQPSEPASAEGIIAQQMRLTDSFGHILSQTVGGMLDLLHQENKSLRRQVEHSQDLHASLMLERERLLDGRAQRELEERREEIKIKQVERAGDLIAPLIPTIVNKMAGKKVLPEKTIPAWETAKQFMGSLDKEQVEMFIMGLQPTQRVAFTELWNTFQTEHAEEQARKAEEEARRKERVPH